MNYSLHKGKKMHFRCLKNSFHLHTVLMFGKDADSGCWYSSGTIPVVVGPPNIEDFSPGPGSILYIKELSDVESVAKTMKYLADNPEAYNQSLRYFFCSYLIKKIIFQILWYDV